MAAGPLYGSCLDKNGALEHENLPGLEVTTRVPPFDPPQNTPETVPTANSNES